MTGEDVPTTGVDDAAWQPVARGHTYEMVIAAIEEQILSGKLRVGDPLPPERELATRLQVSRPAVREALRVLAAQGVVRSAVGRGPAAGTFVASMPSEALTHFLRLHVALSNFAVSDIVDARVTLESSSVALAARMSDPDRLAGARKALAAMETVTADRSAFNDADTAFHTAIAEAGGNTLVTAMTVAIRNAQRPAILAAFRALEDWETVREHLMREHRAILAAIEEGDADRAATLAAAHIRNSYARLPALHGMTAADAVRSPDPSSPSR